MTDVSSPPEYARTQLAMLRSPIGSPLEKRPRHDDTQKSKTVREPLSALDYVGGGKAVPVRDGPASALAVRTPAALRWSQSARSAGGSGGAKSRPAVRRMR